MLGGGNRQRRETCSLREAFRAESAFGMISMSMVFKTKLVETTKRVSVDEEKRKYEKLSHKFKHSESLKSEVTRSEGN